MSSEFLDPCYSPDPGETEVHSRPRSTPRADGGIVSLLSSGEASCVHNFVGDNINQWRLVALACGPDCKQFSELPAGEMELQYFYCHRIEMVSSRDGEVIEPIRCVLITPQLEAYGFVSDYIARELETICQIFGRGPWIPALPIKIRKFQTRKGNQCYSIGPV